MDELPAGYSITTDQSKIDVDAAHAYLTRSYWAAGISKQKVARAIKESLCFSICFEDTQIGFARVISDFATMAYLADVYVLEDHRGQGLSKALLHTVHSYPDLQGLRSWMLLTQDAQGLYEQFGWTQYPHPERFMRIDHPEAYQ